MPYNFNEVKGGNPVKDKAREIVMADLIEFFTERYTAEKVTQVDSNMLAVAVGDRTLADGTEGEVCTTIEVVAKDYDVRVVESSGKVFQPYERLIEGDEYDRKKAEREAKAAENARKKAEREAKAKAAREAKKSNQ